MLRIDVEETDTAWIVRLQGKLAGHWVKLLEDTWDALPPEPRPRRLVLSDVSFIGIEGEQLLERLWRKGANLVTAGCMNLHTVEQIRQRVTPRPKSARGR